MNETFKELFARGYQARRAMLDIRLLRQPGPIRFRSEQGMIDSLSGNDHSLTGAGRSPADPTQADGPRRVTSADVERTRQWSRRSRIV